MMHHSTNGDSAQRSCGRAAVPPSLFAVKGLACGVVAGLLMVIPVGGQQPTGPPRQHRTVVPGSVRSGYRLSLTAMEPKFESRIGMSSRRVEEQVEKRLAEGLGWWQLVGEQPRGRVQRPEGKVRVEWDITELDFRTMRRQSFSYRFRVVVDTPQGWPAGAGAQGGPEAWHWEKGGEGVSAVGDLPRKYRQDLDRVLGELINAWQARFK